MPHEQDAEAEAEAEEKHGDGRPEDAPPAGPAQAPLVADRSLELGRESDEVGRNGIHTRLIDDRRPDVSEARPA